MTKIRPDGFHNPYQAYGLRLPEDLTGVTLRRLWRRRRARLKAAGLGAFSRSGRPGRAVTALRIAEPRP
ncbi:MULTISPECIES: hypothetical protein [unclassified Streptosporangium]|uniref:hypothetical protein n=1 Tax=Streptosporangium sp. NPDC005286 TaxID=3154463 RepID=UPI0033B3B6CC